MSCRSARNGLSAPATARLRWCSGGRHDWPGQDQRADHAARSTWPRQFRRRDVPRQGAVGRLFDAAGAGYLIATGFRALADRTGAKFGIASACDPKACEGTSTGMSKAWHNSAISRRNGSPPGRLAQRLAAADTIDHTLRFAKIYLSMSWRVRQRHERLASTRPAQPDIICYEAPAKAMLFAQTFEYPFGAVPLLHRRNAIRCLAVAQPPQCCVDGVFRHALARRLERREKIPSIARQRTEFLQ